MLGEGNLLYVLEDGGHQPAGEYPFSDVEIEFRPLFRAQRSGTRYSGFGIHVDAGTGDISFDPGPRPANAPRNFLLEVAVRTNAGGKRTPAQIPPLQLRIHVHESVRQIWLTPDSMTIHPLQIGLPDDTLHRFTAVAEFDDDTVGDVTTQHHLIWSTPGTAAPQVDADGFITVFSADVVGTTIPVAATTSAAWGSKTDTANAFVSAPWSAGPPLVATLVEGPPAAWMTVPTQADLSANVLLLGIGFPDEDNDAFEMMVAGMCRQIKRDLITRPYDLLSDAMNFWRLRAPAKARGVTVRSEVVAAGPASTLALNVTPASRPPAAGRWSVGHLMFAAGRPMPADFTREVIDLRTEFAQRVDAAWALPVLDETTLTSDTIRDWRLEGKRMLVDAIDGVPPLVVGSPPSVQNDAAEPGYMQGPSGYRGTDRHLNAFLTAIVADNGATVSGGRPLGTLWASDGFAFDNRRLVVMIGATASGRSNFDGKVLIGMDQGGVWAVEPVLGRKALRLKVSTFDLPFLDTRRMWRVTAHELGHALTLGDEYAGSAATFTDPDPFGNEFEQWSNVLSLGSVLKTPDAGAPPAPGASKISGELVKWRWPRMRRVAVITDPPIEVDGKFVYPLAPRHGFQFKKVDPAVKVRLRARTPGAPLRRFTTNIVTSGSPFVEVSDSEFAVDAIGPAGDSITLRRVSGNETQATLNRFKAGSLIFETVPPPAGSPPAEYPFAELLTFGVRKWLTARGTSDPIFACSAELEYQFAYKLQLPDFDAFPFTFSPRNNARLIGLYKSGGGYACGTYHPAGLCMMRQQLNFDEFCAVCRYSLVDFIDPSVHPDIEKDLAARNFE